MEKKQLLLVLLASTTSYTRMPSFIMPTKNTRSINAIKEEIGEYCQSILTNSCDLIAFLSNVQKETITYIQSLLTSEKNFFSRAKAQELEKYLQELKNLKKELETTQKKITMHIQNMHTICNP